MWGLSFIEYCLYVRPVNQRRLVSVREDLIDDKVSLEEVEARIFGVPVRPDSSSLYSPIYANTRDRDSLTVESIDMTALRMSCFTIRKNALTRMLSVSNEPGIRPLPAAVDVFHNESNGEVCHLPVGLTEDIDIVNATHKDCLAARHNYLELYFGMSKSVTHSHFNDRHYNAEWNEHLSLALKMTSRILTSHEPAQFSSARFVYL